MTSTTTETRQEHERPCFCDSCLMMTLDDLMSERARLLDDTLRDGRNCDSRELAEELIAAIPVSARGTALERLLEWDHLMPRVMAVDCLLDECDTRSYDTLHEMSGILLAAIRAQAAEGRSLRIIIEEEIRLKRDLLSLSL